MKNKQPDYLESFGFDHHTRGDINCKACYAGPNLYECENCGGLVHDGIILISDWSQGGEWVCEDCGWEGWG